MTIKQMMGVALMAGVMMAGVASAQQTVNFGWEDPTHTILGSYKDITATNVTAPDPVYAGSRSLKLVDGADSGTPQAYVGWVTGLNDGDQVTAGFWCYDTTPGASPSGRIWGHYTNGTIDDYAGSASGSYDYPAGDGWSYLEYTWTFDSDGGSRDGLVIEARTYSSPGDTVWVDDLTITAPDGATISVPEPATMSLLALGGLALIRRRK
jgi:hypothetical protein